MTIQFQMTADEAMEFFERVSQLEVDNEETRIDVMLKMIEDGYKINVFHTNRTPEQIAKDASKHGSTLYYKFNGDEDEITGTA